MKKNKPLNITRRDFVSGGLIGSGAALLSAGAPLVALGNNTTAPKGVFIDPWTGYGGIGDYALSNGNTASVREAAHLIRDGKASELSETATDTNEEFDLVIIGGGFAGAAAAFQFKQEFGDSGKCLIIDNHSIFGGEAKQNEFEVDGYRLFGPQGSNGFSFPSIEKDELPWEVFNTVGIPDEYRFVEADKSRTAVTAPYDSYYSMYWGEKHYDVGYYFGGKSGENGKWVKNPWSDDLARTPWPEKLRKDLIRAYEHRADKHKVQDFDRWLDSMSYADLLENHLGLDARVTDFVSPISAIANFGAHANAISAYAASLINMPGTTLRDVSQMNPSYSFPGGNTGLYRYIIKHLIPKSIEGRSGFEDIVGGKVRFDALDKPDQSIRMRLNSTALDVRHIGTPHDSEYVSITYAQNGKVRSIRAKSVVLSIAGFVAQRIVRDLPEPLFTAYDEFHHAPVLVANVALTNWRFLDRLGISSARWFEGFGTFCSIRRPMIVGEQSEPFDPDKPIVLTFYTPFTNPQYGIKEQGIVGRTQLLSKSYAQFEAEIINQMTQIFGGAGFQAHRDIAGIVLNRWGHAYNSPQPGFYFGLNGQPGPRQIVQKGFGRIQFGHSELGARMNYRNALTQGAQAAARAMEYI